jgi:hypothetical protein
LTTSRTIDGTSVEASAMARSPVSSAAKSSSASTISVSRSDSRDEVRNVRRSSSVKLDVAAQRRVCAKP